MRFLIKLVLKVHIKLWRWFKPWGEREAVATGAHFSNAFCNAMDAPGTFIPFVFGPLVGREISKPIGGSWVPSLWKLMFFVFAIFAILDLVISIFALIYILFAIIASTIIASIFGWEEADKEHYGHVKNKYLYDIWHEVDVEHDLYVATNLLHSINSFQC